MGASSNTGARNRLHPLFEKSQKQPYNRVLEFTKKDST